MALAALLKVLTKPSGPMVTTPSAMLSRMACVCCSDACKAFLARTRSVTSRCTDTQWVNQPVLSAMGAIVSSTQNSSPLLL